MVNGMDSFAAHFRDFPDCYTIIGGAACDISMTAEGMDFRATKDIDMILVLEDRFPGFTERFWEYIKAGGYTCGWKNSETVHFYRFTDPKEPGFPAQIELFSRDPGYHLEDHGGVVPLHIDDETSSLSAILLDDDYYAFMLSGRELVEGVSVLNAEHLIPFKMYAWLDLTTRKANGEHVNERDLRKHKLDVFRLLQIVSGSARVEVAEAIRQNIGAFLTAMESETINMRQIGISVSQAQAIERLRAMYL